MREVESQPSNSLRTIEMTTKSSHITRSLQLFLSLFQRTNPKINEVNSEAKFSRFLGQNIPTEYNSIKCTAGLRNNILRTCLSEHKGNLQSEGGNKSKNKQHGWTDINYFVLCLIFFFDLDKKQIYSSPQDSRCAQQHVNLWSWHRSTLRRKGGEKFKAQSLLCLLASGA